jgi:peptide/nickel transport system substrate-binding protein
MKKRVGLVFLLGILLLFSAIGFGQRIPSDTLVVGMNTGIFITLDPGAVYEVASGKIVDACYAKLLKMEGVDGVLTPVPDLAESWDISEDLMTYTFYLRKDARFSNGDFVTAEDMVWSIKRHLSLGKPSTSLIRSIGINADNMDETIKLIDDHTLSLTFDQPYASNIILGILTNQFTGAINKKVALTREVDGDLAEVWLTDNTIGAGPYVLVNWERNNLVTLQTNPYYYGEEPKIKRILVRDIPEAANQRLLLERGDIDVAWNLTGLLLDEATKNPNVVGVTVLGHSNEYLGMNASWGPLADPLVRQAVRYSINYEEIIDTVVNGYAIMNQGFVSKGYFGYYESNPFYQDVDKAKALLAEAGYPDGFEVELMTGTTTTRMEEAEKIQADLAKVGIKANVVIVQMGQAYTIMRAQSHQMIIGGWGNDYPDADNLAMAFANYDFGQLAWRSVWNDPYAITLCNWGRLEPNPDKREQIYKDLTEYWLHNSPFAMLYQPLIVFGVRTEVKNFEEAAFGYGMVFDFTKLYK